jgi:uncharacterized membrane protein YfcA
MRPSALVLNLVVAAIAAIGFARAGWFRWRLFRPFALTSVPFAFLGGSIVLPDAIYKRILELVLLFAAYRLWRHFGRGRGEEILRPPPIVAALFRGAAIGMLSGLTGVGGGIFVLRRMLALVLVVAGGKLLLG